MNIYRNKPKAKIWYRLLSAFIAVVFGVTGIMPPGIAQAQVAPSSILNLPVPGLMVTMSPGFAPTLVKGITIHPENPLEFDFLVDTGDEQLSSEELKQKSNKLIKYFLASLTVPEDEVWVNLSPYEKDRMIPNSFGQTQMGRDLLAQDYILKQLTASLMYPEDELGKKFWNSVYEKAYELYGTTEIPLSTFNKVWIVPEEAVVYEHEQTAYVVHSHLKVMLEEDYVAMAENNVTGNTIQTNIIHEVIVPEIEYSTDSFRKDTVPGTITSQIIREILVPEIEKEVNEGTSFAQLRQIYNSAILATWYKINLKNSLLGQVYINQNKVKGIDLKDTQVNEDIYNQYLEAFKKGVYNYIREDYDPTSKELIPRKYFSGGLGISASPILTVLEDQGANRPTLVTRGSLAEDLGAADRLIINELRNTPADFSVNVNMLEVEKNSPFINNVDNFIQVQSRPARFHDIMLQNGQLGLRSDKYGLTIEGINGLTTEGINFEDDNQFEYEIPGQGRFYFKLFEGGKYLHIKESPIVHGLNLGYRKNEYEGYQLLENVRHIFFSDTDHLTIIHSAVRTDQYIRTIFGSNESLNVESPTSTFISKTETLFIKGILDKASKKLDIFDIIEIGTSEVVFTYNRRPIFRYSVGFDGKYTATYIDVSLVEEGLIVYTNDGLIILDLEGNFKENLATSSPINDPETTSPLFEVPEFLKGFDISNNKNHEAIAERIMMQINILIDQQNEFDDFHNAFSKSTGAMINVLIHLIQNIWQHEYAENNQQYSSPDLYTRVFFNESPEPGIRVEFWGPGEQAVPKKLTVKEWFTVNDKPWKFLAPADSINGGGQHTGLGFMFLKALETGHKIGNGIYFGWRKAEKNESPGEGGNIISVHIPLKQKNNFSSVTRSKPTQSDSLMTNLNEEEIDSIVSNRMNQMDDEFVTWERVKKISEDLAELDGGYRLSPEIVVLISKTLSRIFQYDVGYVDSVDDSLDTLPELKEGEMLLQWKNENGVLATYINRAIIKKSQFRRMILDLAQEEDIQIARDLVKEAEKVVNKVKQVEEVKELYFKYIEHFEKDISEVLDEEIKESALDDFFDFKETHQMITTTTQMKELLESRLLYWSSYISAKLSKRESPADFIGNHLRRLSALRYKLEYPEGVKIKEEAASYADGYQLLEAIEDGEVHPSDRLIITTVDVFNGEELVEEFIFQEIDKNWFLGSWLIGKGNIINISKEVKKIVVAAASPVITDNQLTDNAVFAAQSKKKGGIDLNPAHLDLQIKRDGSGVPLPLLQQPIENMHIEGFVPVIINVTPIMNLPMLLGVTFPEEESQDVSFNFLLGPVNDRKLLFV